MIMNKLEALENIKKTWENKDLALGDKIVSISSDFYEASLDLEGTAAYIKATPAELDTLLMLSQLDENLIDMMSEVDPPKTTWAILANANDDEIREALIALKSRKNKPIKEENYTFSEFVFQKMLEVSGPTQEQKIAALSGEDLRHAYNKASSYTDALTDWENDFLKNVSGRKKSGKTLTNKQITILVRVLNKIADKDIISRNSIDNDQDICNRILDALER